MSDFPVVPGSDVELVDPSYELPEEPLQMDEEPEAPVAPPPPAAPEAPKGLSVEDVAAEVRRQMAATEQLQRRFQQPAAPPEPEYGLDDLPDPIVDFDGFKAGMGRLLGGKAQPQDSISVVEQTLSQKDKMIRDVQREYAGVLSQEEMDGLVDEIRTLPLHQVQAVAENNLIQVRADAILGKKAREQAKSKPVVKAAPVSSGASGGTAPGWFREEYIKMAKLAGQKATEGDLREAWKEHLAEGRR